MPGDAPACCQDVGAGEGGQDNVEGVVGGEVEVCEFGGFDEALTERERGGRDARTGRVCG